MVVTAMVAGSGLQYADLAQHFHLWCLLLVPYQDGLPRNPWPRVSTRLLSGAVSPLLSLLRVLVGGAPTWTRRPPPSSPRSLRAGSLVAPPSESLPVWQMTDARWCEGATLPPPPD